MVYTDSHSSSSLVLHFVFICIVNFLLLFFIFFVIIHPFWYLGKSSSALASARGVCNHKKIREYFSKVSFFFPLAGLRVEDQGPVVQSVVSLSSSLRVISLTILADSIYNILTFFAEKM